MYKITIENNNYLSYTIVEIKNYQPIIININPFDIKLFNNDTFNLPNEIIHSPIRLNKYITGILSLTKTYGKEGKKFLYLCEPDDKRIPHFLILYSIPVTFEKTLKSLYITFEFKHWNNKLPVGTITQNFGPVDEIHNYYEYMMYSKSLNVSIQDFTKKSLDTIKNANTIIHDIINKYNIPIIDDNVFTIDTPNTIDFDDGMSIKNNIISVYISNVPIIINYLNLWGSFTNRISNIYLPNKKYNMLPSIICQLCSLNKKELKICLKVDFNIDTNETHISNCAVKIKNNYEYNDELLNKNEDYSKIKLIYKNKNSSKIVELLMIKTNTAIAEIMNQHKNGIYKIINNLEELSTSNYELYNESNSNYLTITSPIRRLVDILNIYKLCVNKNIFQFNPESNAFYLNWINKLDYINITSKNIRKVQSNCNILTLCLKNNHCFYKGNIFDKVCLNNKYKYQVYLNELNVYSKIYSNIELDEQIEYNFKLFVFQNEGSIKNKIKLDII